MELLIPDWADLAGWAGVFVVTLVFVGGGRLVSIGRAPPEIALVAGWGGACLFLTLWGVATPLSLSFPAAVVAVSGGAGLLLPSVRLRVSEWRGMGRIVAVALPLLAIMASARPSLPDTFLNLLPNAVYLADHSVFPADDRADSHSLLPGAPYNLQLAGFFVSLVTRRSPTNAMIGFNIVLQLAFALLLARLIERKDDSDAPPSWSAAALGLLLTTALNPGFVARYHLSTYSEASVTVTLAFAAWLAARALECLAARRSPCIDLAALAMSLCALVNIKQDSVALAAGVVAVAAILAASQYGEGRAKAAVLILAAGMPAALLYLAWRWYVLRHFAVGELKLLPPERWQLDRVPLILHNMAGALAQKPYFVLAVIAAVGGLIWREWRVGLDGRTRVAVLLVGVMALYNAALLFTYVAHFDGEIGATAHSYFRYNTHLGLLLILTLTLLARDAEMWHRVVAATPRGAVPAGLLAAALLCPIVFFGFLRFDLEVSQQRAWFLADRVRDALNRDPLLALVLPGDNGSLATMLDALIRLTPPRYVDADLRYGDTATRAALDRLAAAGFVRVLVSCTPAGDLDLVAGSVALLERGERWRVVSSWSYPAVHLKARPSHVIAEAPLCL
jgi:hypothetical protein